MKPAFFARLGGALLILALLLVTMPVLPASAAPVQSTVEKCTWTPSSASTVYFNPDARGGNGVGRWDVIPSVTYVVAPDADGDTTWFVWFSGTYIRILRPNTHPAEAGWVLQSAGKTTCIKTTW